VLLYTLLLIALSFSELMFFVEPRENISDLPTALWFTIVTMTTVGYGEITPTEGSGHTVASVLIIISALYMAIPIGIVGNAFSQVWGDRDRLLVMQRFRNAFLEGGFTLDNFQEIFSMFDEDGSGELDVEEFGLMLKTMQMNLDEERVYMLYQALDKEGQGRITLEALLDVLMPKAYAAELLKQGLRAQHLTPIIHRTLTRGGSNLEQLCSTLTTQNSAFNIRHATNVKNAEELFKQAREALEAIQREDDPGGLRDTSGGDQLDAEDGTNVAAEAADATQKASDAPESNDECS